MQSLTKAQARAGVTARLDAREDMSNRAMLGMPVIDFGVGEPCGCALCTLRVDLLEISGKRITGYRAAEHSSF